MAPEPTTEQLAAEARFCDIQNAALGARIRKLPVGDVMAMNAIQQYSLGLKIQSGDFSWVYSLLSKLQSETVEDPPIPTLIREVAQDLLDVINRHQNGLSNHAVELAVACSKYLRTAAE